MPDFSPFWQDIDAVCVINMDSRPDRWEEFCARGAALIPPEKLHRISAVVGKDLPGYGEAPWFRERCGERAGQWAGAAGCALSHRKLLEIALAQGWQRVLVLEDDAQFAADAAARLSALAAFLPQMDKGAAMLYLGYSKPVPYGCKIFDMGGQGAVWSVNGVLATHAYLLNRAAFAPVLALMPQESDVWDWLSRYRAVDVMYRLHLKAKSGTRIYLLYPDMVVQSGSCSDIRLHGGSTDFRMKREPWPLFSFKGICYILAYPLIRLKVGLNSIRTHRRALRGGFPGKRRAKPEK